MSDDQVRGEIEAISIAGRDIWLELQGRRPEIVYHYTSVEGLVGIVSSGALWATDLRFVNDAAELDHALATMTEAVERARSQYRDVAPLMLLERLSEAIALKDRFPSVHSVSFSENGDLLSQWRAYGGSGGGYAIGFAAFDLLPDFGEGIPAGGGSIHRVIYEPAIQDLLLDGVIDQGCGLIERVGRTGGDIGSVADALVGRLLSGSESGLLYCLKNEGWAEEAEWRTIYALPDDESVPIEFRTVGSIPVPYLQLRDGRQNLPIREVVLGPSTPVGTTETALTSLLHRYGYMTAEVKRSELPLRW